MAVETELKCSLSEPAAAALPGHPLLLLAGPGHTASLRTQYFDSADGRLAAAALALRLRHVDGAVLVTVKSAGTDSFGLQRGEWEWTAAGDADHGLHPDDVARAWAQTPLRALSADAAALQQLLVPVFGTAFQRRRWHLDWGRSRIELALDQGQVLAWRDGAPQRAALCELELEVKRGSLDDAWDLAWALAQDLPLQLCPINKAQRAAALARGQRPQPPALGAAATLRWLSTWCAQLAVWGERIGSADDADDVHQFRVSARRLRNALRWCDAQLPARSRRWFDTELRWAMQLAGAVRDADVLLPDLDADAAARLRHARVGQRAALQAYVLSARWGRLLLALARWAQRWERDLDAAAARRLAARVLEAEHQGWHRSWHAARGWLQQARDGQLPAADAAHRLHRLRLRSKRLRLACERLGPWAEPAAQPHWAALAQRCAALQSALGHWHDAQRLSALQSDAHARAAAAAQALQALAGIGWD